MTFLLSGVTSRKTFQIDISIRSNFLHLSILFLIRKASTLSFYFKFFTLQLRLFVLNLLQFLLAHSLVSGDIALRSKTLCNNEKCIKKAKRQCRLFFEIFGALIEGRFLGCSFILRKLKIIYLHWKLFTRKCQKLLATKQNGIWKSKRFVILFWNFFCPDPADISNVFLRFNQTCVS